VSEPNSHAHWSGVEHWLEAERILARVQQEMSGLTSEGYSEAVVRAWEVGAQVALVHAQLAAAAAAAMAAARYPRVEKWARAGIIQPLTTADGRDVMP
jgi:hypothetical protein